MIRQANAGDLGILCASLVQLMRHTRAGETDHYTERFPTEVDDQTRSSAERYLREGLALLWEEAGEAVGCLMGIIGDSVLPICHSGPVGHLSVCWVRADHRRKGIARALEARWEEWLLERGVRHVELNYMATNTLARDVWAARGYRPFRINAYKTLIGE